MSAQGDRIMMARGSKSEKLLVGTYSTKWLLQVCVQHWACAHTYTIHTYNIRTVHTYYGMQQCTYVMQQCSIVSSIHHKPYITFLINLRRSCRKGDTLSISEVQIPEIMAIFIVIITCTYIDMVVQLHTQWIMMGVWKKCPYVIYFLKRKRKAQLLCFFVSIRNCYMLWFNRL